MWRKTGNCCLYYPPNSSLIIALILMLILTPLCPFSCARNSIFIHFYDLLWGWYLQRDCPVFFVFFPELDHREIYWLYSFIILLSFSTFFHFDQLLDAFLHHVVLFLCFLNYYLLTAVCNSYIPFLTSAHVDKLLLKCTHSMYVCFSNFFSSLCNISHSLLLSFQLELSCFQPIHSMLSLSLSMNSVLITSIEIISHILLSLLLKPCSVPHGKVHLADCWPLFMLSSGFFPSETIKEKIWSPSCLFPRWTYAVLLSFF